MSTQSTTKTPRKRGTRPAASASKPTTAADELHMHEALHGDGDEPIGRKDSIGMGAGVVVLAVAAFTMLALVSHLVTGGVDQIALQEGYVGGTSNWAGYIGALWSKYWITENFGFGAFMLPVFLFAMSLRLTGAYYVRLWKWFVNCAFLLCWISVASAFFLTSAFASSTSVSYISPGGYHGMQIVSLLEQHIGIVGTFIVLVLSLLAYLCYVSAETIRILRRLMHPGQLARQMRERYPVLARVANLLRRMHGGSDKPEDNINNNGNANVDEHGNVSWGAYDNDKKNDNSNKKVDNTDDSDTPNVIDLTGDDGQDVSAKQTDNTVDISTADADKETDIDPDIPLAVVATPDPDKPGDPELIVEPEHVEQEADKSKPLEPYDPKLDLEYYRYPTLDLLKHYDTDSRSYIDREELTKNKDQIVTVLKSFGVEISSIKATVGPTITLYEITPAPGVRITKIRNLEDDIALSLAALGIRIIAPIPGKGTIGIEVPNAKPQIVSMESIINSRKFQESTMELPMALGKTITNEVFMADLAKMPHLLVAGATGQGKSVGLNAIITSLLYKKHPAELKFVMVDPKKVEFSIYSPIVNHFLAQIEDDPDEPIITDVQKVVYTLKSLCVEMDTRYDLLKRAHAKNIKEYNEKFRARQLNPNNGHHFLPYIVVVIDEFGDLIMTAGKEIELPIARIAQLARAVGMHMIIATQRPTTNIITGTIKANFPARMAFRVSAMIDSRTILDRPGANQLIGKGDMLFLAGSEPVRLQCAFVDTPEVEAIAGFIARQQSYPGPFPLPLPPVEDAGSDRVADVDVQHLDPLFEEAARLIIVKQQGSTSLIQRKFSIGFNRAGRLMDQLERVGVVGPAQGSKPRDVLIQDEASLQMLIDNVQ